MKFGLRKQFAKVLGLANLHYFGHVKIGTVYDITIEDLYAMNPSAVIFSCGAQGLNQLGLPGEAAKGVYRLKTSFTTTISFHPMPPWTSPPASA